MKKTRLISFIVLVILAGITLYIKNCTGSADVTNPKTNTTKDNGTTASRGLNRNPSNINYSKHARCRMDCRHVTESEVKEILTDGKINYSKSELQAKDCQKKYVVEGYSKDHQHLRIIFAPCNTEVTVVTVIDLDKEWECHCEGDDNS